MNAILMVFRYGAASKTFSRLLQLLTDSDCYCSEKCVISIPSVVSVYTDCIGAHVAAALYDEAVTLCDTALSKCLPSLLSFNALSAKSLPQARHSNDVSHPSAESTATGITRKRNRSVSSTDDNSVGQLITSKPIMAQIALYKTEALLELGRADDALSCVDRLASLV